MSIEEKMLANIEELRNLMHQLLIEKNAVIDNELIEVSQRLDNLLNEYYKLLRLIDKKAL